MNGARTRLTTKGSRDGEPVERRQSCATTRTLQGTRAVRRVEIRQNPTLRLKIGMVKLIKSRKSRDGLQSKKKKLTDAVEKLVEEGGHHLVDAVGMAGLDVRAVDEAMIDEMLGAGLAEEDEVVAEVPVAEDD